MDADNDNELPRTRAAAKAMGSKRYFTGNPCKRGHIAPRFTSNRRCIECSLAARKEWGEANSDHLIGYRKKVYAENKEDILAAWGDWYTDNHERELEKKRKRYAASRETALEYAKSYRAENPDKVRVAANRWRAENPDKVKEGWQKWYYENGKSRDAKRRATPQGRIDGAMSRGIYESLRDAKDGRTWESLVGYTITDLMAHLEKQFLPGMTWGNYGRGGWHIDHKIPRSAFNYSDPSHIDFKRCWALSNLQPLWEFDNISKGAKLSAPFQPSLALGVNDNSKTKENA